MLGLCAATAGAANTSAAPPDLVETGVVLPEEMPSGGSTAGADKRGESEGVLRPEEGASVGSAAGAAPETRGERGACTTTLPGAPPNT